ncbi:MAG: hypothetical protein IKM33_00130 [Clostridia bacterium]|nr:hypothetical protein [Clostridia bacterium]
MKKLISLLIVCAMLLSLALSMTSCSASARLERMEEPQRAEYFYYITDLNMSYASSMTYEQTTVLEATINGVAYKQTTEAAVTFVSDRNGMSLVEKAKTTVDTVGGGTVIYSDTGYVDGVMFSRNKEGGNETKLKSSVSLEDYSAFNQYRNAKAPLITVGEGYSNTMTCKKNDDNTWTATYEGFTAEGLKPFLYMLRGVDYYLTAEHEITDVRMTLQADARLYLTYTKIEFIFADNSEVEYAPPVVTLENTYYGWNSTVMDEAYDLSSFTEVDDLRAVDVFLDGVLDKSYEISGAVDTTLVTSTEIGDYDSEMTDRQKMAFSNRDGLAFDLSYSTEDYEYKTGYADGQLRVRVYQTESDELIDSITEPMSEADARATVAQVIDPEGFTPRSFSDITVVDAEKGIVRFALSDAFENAYREQYEMAGAVMSTFSGYCEAVMANGVLTGYHYYIETTLQIEGQTMKTTVDMTITFSETEKGTETV